jgi:hypothetical protein
VSQPLHHVVFLYLSTGWDESASHALSSRWQRKTKITNVFYGLVLEGAGRQKKFQENANWKMKILLNDRKMTILQ